MLKPARLLIPVVTLFLSSLAWAADQPVPDGFVSLFNGKDLAGWKVPEGDNGHWKVVDGAIDYDAGSEAKGDKALWGEREYENYVLQLDWRLKEAPYINKGRALYLARWHAREGHPRQGDADGTPGRGFRRVPPRRRLLPGQHLVLADRLRRDVQHPHGSQDASRASRGGHPAHPGRQAGRRMEPFRDHRERQDGQGRAERDHGHPGATIPDLPARGRIAFQHHGGKNKAGEWNGPPSLVQFKNIYIKELPSTDTAGAAHPKSGPIRALLITGGHDHERSFYSLFDGYKELPRLPVADSATAFQNDLRGKYDVLILYDFSRDLNEKARKNLRDYVESGKGGIVVLHHALLDYPDWAWWAEDVVGGRYRLKRDGQFPSSTVKNDQPMTITPAEGHPITAGLEHIPGRR